MSSILTNMSAMSAVANLAATQKSLAQTENMISTGLKVSGAKDNAAYWSIATSMKTTTGELSAVSDSLNLGSSVVGTATAALSSTISVLQKMQQDLVSAQQSGVDHTQVYTDIQALQTELSTTISSASFNGVNLLDQASMSITTQNIVSSVSGAGSTFTVNTISIAYSGNALTTSGATGAKTGLLDATSGVLTTAGGGTGASLLTFAIDATTTSSQLTAISQYLDTKLLAVQTAAAKLGAAQTNIDLQSTFTKALSDSITTGVGSLVDADMNEASTRLNALQTQQQLGIQSLSVANQNSQIILKLFGG